MSKTFPLGDVLSIATGYLIGPGGLPAMSAIMSFLVRRPIPADDPWTLSCVRHMVMPTLFEQHPFLAQALLAADTISSTHSAAAYCRVMERRYGEEIALEPLEPETITTALREIFAKIIIAEEESEPPLATALIDVSTLPEEVGQALIKRLISGGP